MSAASPVVKTDPTDQERTPAETDGAAVLSDESVSNISELDVAALAYSLWEKRGCPDGCPEVDWFQAEQELRSR